MVGLSDRTDDWGVGVVKLKGGGEPGLRRPANVEVLAWGLCRFGGVRIIACDPFRKDVFNPSTGLCRPWSCAWCSGFCIRTVVASIGICMKLGCIRVWVACIRSLGLVWVVHGSLLKVSLVVSWCGQGICLLSANEGVYVSEKRF